MKFPSSVVAGALLVGSALAHPVGLGKRQESDNIDSTVLQFALTLEHLENVFYKQALDSLSEQQFIDAGYDAKYYSDIKYIAFDEEQHVKLLTSALTEAGVTPVKACEYKFPFTDVESFISTSTVLEGVGSSAYTGAAGLITSKEYLTVAASILAVEALHTSLQRSAQGLVPAASPYMTPLSPNPVYTLAASFIVSCPESNAPLPFKAFPALSSDSGSPLAMGMPAEFSFDGDAAGKYATFVSGLTVTSVMIEHSGDSFEVVIPEGISGQSYVFVTNADVTGGPGSLTDSAINAGPAVVEVTPNAPDFDPSYE
ncbi:hypothetical protein GJ744_005554 [Endocarpon pusillum]|uniref:Protein rds1 n=1 Tax=Endocarpon pusillum TaxID=364733 RepID=A0A8H7AL16_9EURO|nr:hypothetical protein GJ744_005554 [Endocarpon pusillum]